MKRCVILILSALWAAHPALGDARRFPNVEMFINNHRFGETNGLRGDMAETGAATCGHPGLVSKVEWKWIRRESDSDIYRVTRRFPFRSAVVKTDTKEVHYEGTEILLWTDTVQKIGIRPAKKHRRTTGSSEP